MNKRFVSNGYLGQQGWLPSKICNLTDVVIPSGHGKHDVIIDDDFNSCTLERGVGRILSILGMMKGRKLGDGVRNVRVLRRAACAALVEMLVGSERRMTGIMLCFCVCQGRG